MSTQISKLELEGCSTLGNWTNKLFPIEKKIKLVKYHVSGNKFKIIKRF